jgi:hypothetical protein
MLKGVKGVGWVLSYVRFVKIEIEGKRVATFADNCTFLGNPT